MQDTSGANAAPAPTGLASIIPRTQRDADDLPGTWTRMGTRRRTPALPPGILVNDKSESDDRRTRIGDVPAAECSRESAAQSTRVTRQYTRNRELDTQPMSSSSSAAAAIAPEYVMESIVDHGYADDGELLYRIRWYGYAADQDTWEPVRHIPRSHIVRFS